MKKKVLFLCTGNSCRSQMAEGFLRHTAAGRIEVFSAGVKPIQLHPMAIKVMEEIGMDISSHRSKSVDEFLTQKFDYVITVCDNARRVCPVFPGEYEKIHWDLKDPVQFEGTEEEKLVKFRQVRDLIEKNIQNFLRGDFKP